MQGRFFPWPVGESPRTVERALRGLSNPMSLSWPCDVSRVTGLMVDEGGNPAEWQAGMGGVDMTEKMNEEDKMDVLLDVVEPHALPDYGGD